MGIVVFGSVLMDIKGYPFEKLNPEGRNAGRVIQVHGGVSRNVAEDLANIGLHPTFVSVVDESGLSADVVERLRRHQVNVDHILTRPGGLGTWLAVFDEKGDLVSSISQRPDISAIGELLDEKGDEIISSADSVVVEIDMEEQLLSKIFALAEKYHKDIYAVVSNMTIALEHIDYLFRTSCLVCNKEEAGILFSEDYEEMSREEMVKIISSKITDIPFPKLVITLGAEGAVCAERNRRDSVKYHWIPAIPTSVIDTTGCGDAFFAGVSAGLTYGRDLCKACYIGAGLAASVIATTENTCPCADSREFGL